ncbi:hypothetical protein ACHAWC_006136 [Mediolabrus comicus]
MSEKKAVTFDDEELFLLESETIKRDEKFDLPLKFLSELYEHGYRVAEIEDKTDDMNPFFATVSHQMAVYGVHYSPSELRGKVIKFEKENATSLSELSALTTAQLCRLGDIVEESVEDHIIELEKNKGMIEIFDMYCTARFLGVEVRVFTPDFENELVLNRFNETGGKKEFVVAVVMDWSRRPVRLFRTYVVHKSDVLDNPYHMMLKRQKVMK